MADEGDRKHSTESHEKRVIGKGMTSLDSTQVPLKAETGLPDMDAIEGRVPKNDGSKSSQDKSRS